MTDRPPFRAEADAVHDGAVLACAVLACSVFACTALLALAAAARQQALAPLSPGDLAFYTQSAWNALHGRGFTQTVLSFEGQSLLDSVHFSPIRLLYAPAAALGAAGLAALQGAAVGLGLGAVAGLARGAGAPAGVAAGLVVAAAVHPMTLALATTDARPLIFLVPAGLWAARALQAGSRGGLLAAGLLAVAAREEAAVLLAALLPWALGRRRADLALLVGLVMLALAAPLWAWGHLGGLHANEDPAGSLRAILAGQRPLLRDPAEARYLGLCLLGAPTALLAPRLLLPALLGALWLAVFSTLEPVHPAGAGAHYLAVVHPFLWAAAAVGAGRLARRLGPRAGLLPIVLAATTGAPGLLRAVDHGLAWAGADPQVAARQALLAPVVADPGGVLAVGWAAPTLARRERLHLPGHQDEAEADLARIVPELRWAVLPDPLAGEEQAEGLRRWREALTAGGLSIDARAGGAERWRRTVER